MRWLHEGRFAEIYDRHSRLNPFNAPNETRLRQYLDCMFAAYAKDVPGDFLAAGISYGGAPGVIYDFVGLDALAFVHLNATHVAGEAASLPYLYEKLSPGDFILIDYYSFGQGQFEGYDPAIAKIGASVFSMVTGQGVIRKPLH